MSDVEKVNRDGFKSTSLGTARGVVLLVGLLAGVVLSLAWAVAIVYGFYNGLLWLLY